MEHTQSQSQQILAYMQAGNSITGMDTLNLFQSWRLPARIAELRKAGHQIEKENFKLPNDKL